MEALQSHIQPGYESQYQEEHEGITKSNQVHLPKDFIQEVELSLLIYEVRVLVQC